MVPLARRYLFSDRLRFAISAGGVAFAVLLIVLILASYQGQYARAGRLAATAPTNLWVTQAGAPDPSQGASILPLSALEQLKKVPGVAEAQPLFARTMQVGATPNEGTFALAMALPVGPLQIATAEAFGVDSLPGKGQVTLSDLIADEIGVDVGDTAFIGAEPLEVGQVTSLVEGTWSGVVFVSADDSPVLFRHPEAFSFALVTTAPEADEQTVEADIENRLRGTNALTRDEFTDLTRRQIEEQFLPIIAVLVAVAFIVGLAVIALTIYTSTVERVRDYGVLKAVGASPRQLFAVVVRQSVVVAVLGYALGTILGFVAGKAVQNGVPDFATIYRWQDLLAVFVAALVMSIIAAIVPIRRVASVDPAIVFRA